MAFLKLMLLLSTTSLIGLAGFYLYRYLNRKLTNSSSILKIACYALALFLMIGALYLLNLFLIIKLYDYLTY